MKGKIPLLLHVATLCSAAQSAVLHINRDFLCPEGRKTFHIEHSLENATLSKCQQTWMQAGKVIGIHGSENNCVWPCKNISDQGMSVSICGNYTLSAFCENNQQNGDEIEVLFSGRTVKAPQNSMHPPERHYKRWGLLLSVVLSALVVGALVMRHCYRHWGQADFASSSQHSPLNIQDQHPTPPPGVMTV